MHIIDNQQCTNYEISSRKEWLLTNGIGGFAMGTVAGANMRRYHGYLVAAIEPPTKRMVLLANVETYIQAEGAPIGVSAHQYPGTVHPEGYQYLQSFSVGDHAEWHYKASGMQLVKKLAMHKGENTVTLAYQNIGDKPFTLILRPFVSHKFYHANFKHSDQYPQVLEFNEDSRTLIEHDGISLFLHHPEATCLPEAGWYYRFEHLREMERGLDFRDDLFCPCELRYELKPNQTVYLIASTKDEAEPYHFESLDKGDNSLTTLLKEAASKFFIQCEERTSIIAGYPWFTDWGRDTMISLPGICLHTGRIEEAKEIILAYISQMKQGLIPNRFVDQGEEPEYNTVDGTLWFANAIYKTLQANWDPAFAEKTLDALEEVYHWHTKGTLYGIKVDPQDGLLAQGEQGVQLTWMDAKVGDWVITPRYGKPVEINGLWINALRVMEWLATQLKRDATTYKQSAELAESNFEQKFWKESLGYYLDTADPDDASLRPNQLIAMSLPFSPVNTINAQKALQKITLELLTPVGLRTLSTDNPQYKPKYQGSLPELDASYHQGTVWPWLLGPYISALVKHTGDKVEAKRILKNAKTWLTECGIGGITEIYDADEPRRPNGCPWQAWSVAEVLRAWVEDVGAK